MQHGGESQGFTFLHSIKLLNIWPILELCVLLFLCTLLKDLPVNGGVTILHTSIGNGKHHYEVETFLKDQKAKNGFCMR